MAMGRMIDCCALLGPPMCLGFPFAVVSQKEPARQMVVGKGKEKSVFRPGPGSAQLARAQHPNIALGASTVELGNLI